MSYLLRARSRLCCAIRLSSWESCGAESGSGFLAPVAKLFMGGPFLRELAEHYCSEVLLNLGRWCRVEGRYCSCRRLDKFQPLKKYFEFAEMCSYGSVNPSTSTLVTGPGPRGWVKYLTPNSVSV